MSLVRSGDRRRIRAVAEHVRNINSEIFQSTNKAPTVGLEPTTTRLRALRSAD